MSFKVLHILDCFLPETMNWLEKLLEETMESCEHHIFACYYTRSLNNHFQYVNREIETSYPITFRSKLKNFFLNSANSKILIKYVLENDIQIIHFHFGQVAIKFKVWIQKMGLPFCVSLYGFDYEYLVHKNTSIKSDYLFLSKLGAVFIVEGNYSRRIVHNYGVPIFQIFIVHMLFERKCKNNLSIYSQPIRLLQAATFTEKKNQLGLVEALHERHASRFVISFYGEIVDKYYYREFEKAVKSKIKHCIQINDKLNFGAYLKVLSNTHFTVNLSKRSHLHDTEGGCPVLLKDSLSLGKPVISTNHCDIPEILVHECNGFLLPENDTHAVTDLLDHLLALSQKKYKVLCLNAEESVKTNILQKLTREDLIKVYQNMI